MSDTDPAERPPYDLSRHLRSIRVQGGGQEQFLPAKYRVIGLRHDHPAAQIVTEEIDVSEKLARFRCTITLPNGAVATAHAQQKADTTKYVEKAETSAVSRACALLGYGTESALDDAEHADDAEQVRVGTATMTPRDMLVTVSDPMLPVWRDWLRRGLGKVGVQLPRRFERWGDLIGAFAAAGVNYDEIMEKGGISLDAVEELVLRLGRKQQPQAVPEGDS
jgi:hypothetical protein